MFYNIISIIPINGILLFILPLIKDYNVIDFVLLTTLCIECTYVMSFTENQYQFLTDTDKYVIINLVILYNILWDYVR